MELTKSDVIETIKNELELIVNNIHQLRNYKKPILKRLTCAIKNIGFEEIKEEEEENTEIVLDGVELNGKSFWITKNNLAYNDDGKLEGLYENGQITDGKINLSKFQIKKTKTKSKN